MPSKRRAENTPATESSKTKGKATKGKKAKITAEAEDNHDGDAAAGEIVKKEVLTENEL